MTLISSTEFKKKGFNFLTKVFLSSTLHSNNKEHIFQYFHSFLNFQRGKQFLDIPGI